MILTNERKKNDEKHMNKNRSWNEIERRGDNKGKITLGIIEKKPKNFVFGITFLTFFLK